MRNCRREWNTAEGEAVQRQDNPRKALLTAVKEAVDNSLDACEEAGVAPEIMGVGPIEAVRKVLAYAGMTIADVDVMELNEAFAAQVLPVCRELGVDPFSDKLNPHGGAIALGHPYGMTGARIMNTLLNDLETLDRTIGLETMCVGGGQGMAMLVERLN